MFGLFTALKATTFRSLRHRNYRLYFLGQIVSFIGTWMQSAALMWLMYDRTGDPRWPSWLLVAQIGPTILLGAWAGALADRWPKRQLIVRTQTAFLINAILLTAVVATDLAVAWVVLTLQVMNGIIQAIDLPARLAFVPDLVPKEDLINAVGLNSLLFNSARAIGPAVAGGLFWTAKTLPTTDHVTLGAVLCFGLNAVSFVAVLFALNGIHVPGDAHANSSADAGSVWDGPHYLWVHRVLGALVFLTLLLCVFGWPVQTLLPAYTRTRLGLAEDSYGLLVSAVGAGALIAALTTATFGTVGRRAGFLVIGATVATGGLFGLSAATGMFTAAVCCGCVGFGMILFLSIAQSTLQLAVPDEKRGRVMALWAITLSASAPLGHLLAGEAAAEFGVVPVLCGMAVGAGVVVVALVALAAGRGLRRHA